jgi:hypothetical protein
VVFSAADLSAFGSFYFAGLVMLAAFQLAMASGVVLRWLVPIHQSADVARVDRQTEHF